MNQISVKLVSAAEKLRGKCIVLSSEAQRCTQGVEVFGIYGLFAVQKHYNVMELVQPPPDNNLSLFFSPAALYFSTALTCIITLNRYRHPSQLLLLSEAWGAHLGCKLSELQPCHVFRWDFSVFQQCWNLDIINAKQ